MLSRVRGGGVPGGGGKASLELSAVISAKRSKCWKFLARGTQRCRLPRSDRAQGWLYRFLKLELVSPGVHVQDRGESAVVKSTFPLQMQLTFASFQTQGHPSKSEEH